MRGARVTARVGEYRRRDGAGGLGGGRKKFWGLDGEDSLLRLPINLAPDLRIANQLSRRKLNS